MAKTHSKFVEETTGWRAPREYQVFLDREQFKRLDGKRVSVPAMSIPPHFVHYSVDGKLLGTKLSAAAARGRLLGDLEDVLGADHASQILLFGVTDPSGKGEPDLPLVIDLAKVKQGICPIDIYIDGRLEPVAASIAEFIAGLTAEGNTTAKKPDPVVRFKVAHRECNSTEKEINIANLGLKTLPPELGQCTQLRRLDAYGNQLKSLPPEMAHCTALEHLLLDGSPLASLPVIPSLQILSLSGIRLTPALWDSIVAMKKLRTLTLSDCVLGDVPASLGGLTALERLELPGCQVTSLPTELAACKKLTVLWIQRLGDQKTATGLVRLPVIPSLESLRIAHTTITPALWKSIVAMKKLDELSLADSQVSTLVGIGALTKLSSLYLSRCGLKSLPEEVSALSRLETLALGGNPLAKVPVWITSLKKLRTISLGEKVSKKDMEQLKAKMPKLRVNS